jgi:hypothetical protein
MSKSPTSVDLISVALGKNCERKIHNTLQMTVFAFISLLLKDIKQALRKNHPIPPPWSPVRWKTREFTIAD